MRQYIVAFVVLAVLALFMPSASQATREVCPGVCLDTALLASNLTFCKDMNVRFGSYMACTDPTKAHEFDQRAQQFYDDYVAEYNIDKFVTQKCIDYLVDYACRTAFPMCDTDNLHFFPIMCYNTCYNVFQTCILSGTLVCDGIVEFSNTTVAPKGDLQCTSAASSLLISGSPFIGTIFITLLMTMLWTQFNRD
eukprot:GEZU01004127.1.p1 GENE.GEZU01004127.1~~GEZU01004127.1.p1  ORF type:complete len:194 (-),score=49.78 GEZU01004127.1:41-622(-)